MTTYLIVPGLHGSGTDHWQTWLEARLPNVERVHQADWGTPNLELWSARVRAAIDRADGPVVLVAHSFGCLASVEAAAQRPDRVGALMLVAPADPERFDVGVFLQDGRLRAPSVVVASTNDPWMSFDGAAHWASAWGAELINLGPAGHINAAAGFGAWPRGLKILADLRNRVSPSAPRSIRRDAVACAIGQ
ncbi:alpha/beta hydrolase [Hyphomicrobium sp. D-2]|uniref:RBBP9/YdeN family alpha/beta hydrolase n=1 Tax=Hyphomicrobium sp. D-2 TaxID=3041621 RepID=UPI002453ACE0|nr:alpha/beta hydrolase [Hyphomicrobium sp. D-2]MDH4981716.1 alpha/beta hydrolase [Hyphomicrobium sp. D-2]